ncbi:outer membrane protein [Bradyrhizobium sp. WD16]|uniref:outer membrane protein n=1 Tax=Bradyrhizobium sp. WD16 TaxID=1521768 RepID=UPI0020A2DA15|nr:outer membrane protein [Bradyrhizobium sp. WD16]UTD27795.1 porin family protein [Bradyrhizobium sp. WD16]
MKKVLLAGAAVVVLATSASAADLAARAPATYTKAPAMVSPLTNWSGFYAGVMGGYGWSSNSGGNNFKGGFGGGTIGYNWQAAQFVFGVEADAAGSSIKAAATSDGVTVNDSIRALGSATGRLGVAVNSALLYVKGGYAFANNRVNALSGGVSFTESKMHSGWTLGGGVEYMFLPHWSAKAEYMYSDFAGKNYFSNVVVGGIDSGRQQIHTVKGGINYHFN